MNEPADAPKVGILRKRLFKPWMILIPIPLVVGWCFYMTASSWIALGALAGIAAGWYMGDKIPPRSVVRIICLDLESKRARILEMGRKLFTGVTKSGRPWLTLETGLGYELIVARSYDEKTRVLTYPEDGQFSDAAIMAMPGRYRDLISYLVELRNSVADQEMEIDLRAQHKAAELMGKFRDLFTDACYPKSEEDEK